MNVKVIGRDYKQTTKHILDDYLLAIKEYDGEYCEVEMAIDDGTYIIISDSDEIYNMVREDLEELVWEVLSCDDEEDEEALDKLNWD